MQVFIHKSQIETEMSGKRQILYTEQLYIHALVGILAISSQSTILKINLCSVIYCNLQNIRKTIIVLHKLYIKLCVRNLEYLSVLGCL